MSQPDSRSLIHRSGTKPRLLDLFSGAGGCAKGYQRAGFYVVGVDIAPQPRYGGDEFHQGDALEVLRILLAGGTWQGYVLADFAGIHASPPCQHYSTVGKQAATMHGITYPDLVEPTRELLQETGLPYIVENVMGAPLKNAVMLCGSSFGLDLRRHRLFESNVPIMSLPCSHHWQTPRFRSLDKRRGGALATVVGVHGHINYSGERELREKAMDIDWMTPDELAEAIPPAYTEYLGGYLMNAVKELPDAA